MNGSRREVFGVSVDLKNRNADRKKMRKTFICLVTLAIGSSALAFGEESVFECRPFDSLFAVIYPPVPNVRPFDRVVTSDLNSSVVTYEGGVRPGGAVTESTPLVQADTDLYYSSERYLYRRVTADVGILKKRALKELGEYVCEKR